MSIDKDLTKKYGDGIIIDGNKFKEQDLGLIHASPKLDLLIGGGIPKNGCVLTMAGDEKTGKTLTSLHIAGKCQQDNRQVFYLNVEGRLQSRDLSGIKCLDSSKINIISSYRDDNTNESRILTAEEFLNISEKIIHNEPKSVIIIDSVSQLVSAGELEKDIGEASRAPGAVLLSQFFKKVRTTLTVNNIILICIQHFIANTSGYGKTKTASGGRKVRYASDINLEVKGSKLLSDGGSEDTIGKAYGQEITWLCTWSPLCAPGNTTTSTIYYGIGINETAEFIQLATDFGLIKKAASWFSLSFLDEENPKKIQGEKALIEFFEQPENLPHKEKLEKLINQMIYSS